MKVIFKCTDYLLKGANHQLNLRALTRKFNNANISYSTVEIAKPGGGIPMEDVTYEKFSYSPSISNKPQLITVKPDPQHFDDISSIYEKMIYINTFGQHPKWRRCFAKHLAPFENTKILDAACGTGLTTIAILNEAAETKCSPNFSVSLCDQSSWMMKIGQNKIEHHDYKELVNFVQTDVHNLPFENDTFDLAVFTFSFRHSLDIYAEFSRVVKPGGRVGIMDFAYSLNPTTSQWLYNLFLDHIYSKIAYALWGKPEVAYYIAKSIRRSPSKDQVVEMLKSAGFSHVSTKSYMGGCNYHYIGQKIK